MQETSVAALFEIEPTLGQRQARVYEALCGFPDMTNSELAAYLNWPINTVTPRTNELVKAGKVVESCKRKCAATNRTVIAWRVLRQSHQSTIL